MTWQILECLSCALYARMLRVVDICVAEQMQAFIQGFSSCAVTVVMYAENIYAVGEQHVTRVVVDMEEVVEHPITGGVCRCIAQRFKAELSARTTFRISYVASSVGQRYAQPRWIDALPGTTCDPVSPGKNAIPPSRASVCLLYTSDAADE